MLFMAYFKSYPYNQPYFRYRSIETLFLRFVQLVFVWVNFALLFQVFMLVTQFTNPELTKKVGNYLTWKLDGTFKNDPDNIDIQTFLSSGKSMETLVEDAEVIRGKFYIGSMIAGGFLGHVIGLTLLNTVVFRKRQDYEPHKGDCFSCGRCMDYCPVEKTGNRGT